MIPLQTSKHLVINPSEGEATEQAISYTGVISHLMDKVFGKTTAETFRPMVFDEKHVKLFLSNVEARTIASNKFAGKLLQNYEEALAYISSIGDQVYGPDWKAILIKNEILLTPRKLNYSISVGSESLIRRIKEEANGFFVVEVRKYPQTQTTQTTQEN